MEIQFDAIFGIAVVFGAILVSITLHEAMHAFTSHWLGDDTAYHSGRLTLNPLAHIDPITTVLMPIVLYLLIGIPFGAAKPVPFNPARLKFDEFGAALVGIAGPLTNLFLAVVVGLWVRFVIGFDAGFLTDGLLMFMLVNLGFFVFNMIPFPPLDGSRVLYAFAPEPVQNFMATIERGGLTSIALFIFIIYPFIVPIIGPIIQGIASFILGVNFIV